MPGYAVPPVQNKPILIVEPDTIEDLYDNVFYGMMYDPSEGRVTLEILREEEDISIPASSTYLFYEYAHWFSSSKSINFTWKESNKTHLFLEII